MDARARKVLIIGGYGVFGSQISRMLADTPDLRIIIAGRSEQRAAQAALGIGAASPGSSVIGQRIDLSAEIGPQISATGAEIVIHAAGPFQDQDYAVARACIDLGVHYIDLADGRAFVSGFHVLDQPARHAGVLLVSGASSVPGLTSAVIDHLSAAMTAITNIRIGITPGNRAPRGPAVLAGVVGGAGRPMPLWSNGEFVEVPMWQGLRRYRIELPGDRNGLSPRLFCPCDVPDNVLFPQHYGVTGSVNFEAGLELNVMHYGLWALSWLVRFGLMRSLSPLVPLIYRIANLLRPFGTDRGGMLVEIDGVDADHKSVRRRWILIAESGDGPKIPAIPAVILTRKLLSGQIDRVGAVPCVGILDLADFEDAIKPMNISVGVEAY